MLNRYNTTKNNFVGTWRETTVSMVYPSSISASFRCFMDLTISSFSDLSGIPRICNTLLVSKISMISILTKSEVINIKYPTFSHMTTQGASLVIEILKTRQESQKKDIYKGVCANLHFLEYNDYLHKSKLPTHIDIVCF